jgi:hypothetical protein
MADRIRLARRVARLVLRMAGGIVALALVSTAASAQSDSDLAQQLSNPVGGKLYKIDVPAQMPVKQFWALTVYDRATFSFIYTDSGRTTLSSYDVDKMQKNADGGVTLYVGPSAPAGLEANWIPTRDKRPLPAFRYYGATDALNAKQFTMPDFEEVNA